MTNDEVFKLASKFWQKIINDSERFKGNEKSPEALELINDLATLDVGRAFKSKLSKV